MKRYKYIFKDRLELHWETSEKDGKPKYPHIVREEVEIEGDTLTPPTFIEMTEDEARPFVKAGKLEAPILWDEMEPKKRK